MFKTLKLLDIFSPNLELEFKPILVKSFLYNVVLVILILLFTATVSKQRFNIRVCVSLVCSTSSVFIYAIVFSLDRKLILCEKIYLFVRVCMSLLVYACLNLSKKLLTQCDVMVS